MNPILSIIVPVYNVENYIEQCLLSLYSSDVDENNFEVIVVNDGTKDNSMALVHCIANVHNNMHVVDQINGGLSVARNTGLSSANGTFIWFVDSDDWISPGALKDVINIIKSEPNTDVLTFPLQWSYSDPSKNHVDIDIKTDQFLSGVKYIRNIGVTGASVRNIIKKSLLEKANIKFLPGVLHEDGLFGPQMYYQAKCIHLLSKPLYNYRQRDEGSIMHNLKIKSAYDMIKIYGKLMEYCDEYVAEEDKLWWRVKYISYFDIALSFTWHLRKSSEFKNFLNNTSSYRRSECRKLLNEKLQFVNVVKIILIGWFPMMFRKLLLIKP